jgi:hypothetical protein
MYFPPLPKLKKSLANDIIHFEWERQRPGETKPKVIGLAVRGYRQRTIGNPERNDVGEVDDLLYWQSPEGMDMTNANTDPSKLGWNHGVGKPYGMLQPGIWDFYAGSHRGRRPAFRQADNAEVALKYGIRNQGKFLVERMWGWNDPRNYMEWGHQQVNIHPMSISSTSSWLCLTIPVDHSDRWIGGAQRVMKIHKQPVFSVVLIEGPIN